MATTVGMVSLGCSKNQVDAERMMYELCQGGFQLLEDPALAEVVIVNTCGFIQSAKEEAIETILEFCKLKEEGRIKKVLITGCLAERYREEAAELIQEADGVIGIGKNGDICQCVRRALAGERVTAFGAKEDLPLGGGRVLSTMPYYAWLKIAEGCDNHCSYCAIPMIRGHFRSKPMEELAEEAKWLASQGVRELNVIAQDTTRYGEDLYGRPALPELLTKLCEIEGLRWIRVLYCYPERITEELLDVMVKEPKLVKYMDIPIQHVNQEILKRMNRKGSGVELRALLKRIRDKVPGMVLRTTLITGFPGETEEQFTELAEFIRDIRFERLGCFAYSQEEGTPAAAMDRQIEDSVKQRRADNLMELQMMISDQYNQNMVGRTVEVLVEGFDRYAECFFGRTAADAPDIDGKIFFTLPPEYPEDQKLSLGQFVKVKVEDVMDYDLIGEMLPGTEA